MLVGQQAPDFTLDGVVGRGDFKKISLTEFRGKWLVLFFYPLDFTVVCPTEILEFSRREADFKRLNAALLGCSVDSVYSHRAWITANLGPLTYPLLSDIKREVSKKYGCFIEGKGHTNRASFIIDPEGVLQYALYQNTDIGRSVAETLRVLEALGTGERCPVEWKRGEKTLGR
ncbi:MAG TPA: peroxiredoxin [Myxococcaceae bacterium]|nr:peroxiredoxin [Myxococcaceae bacterium]